MTTIKSYTDIEQSKKLAEILPLESADACWSKYDDGQIRVMPMELWDLIKDGLSCLEFTPAWSLSVLLELLPNDDYHITLLYKTNNGWCSEYLEEPKSDTEGMHYEYPESLYSVYDDNSIDAVYWMLIWLLENKKL